MDCRDQKAESGGEERRTETAQAVAGGDRESGDEEEKPRSAEHEVEPDHCRAIALGLVCPPDQEKGNAQDKDKDYRENERVDVAVLFARAGRRQMRANYRWPGPVAPNGAGCDC